MKKIAVVGLGNMGSAIFEALNNSDDFKVVGIKHGEDIEKNTEDCEVVILAVKPQAFVDMTINLEGKVVISIMAGVSVEKIKDKTGSNKVVRVMPNLPLKVKSAVSGWFAPSSITVDERSEVKNILELFGTEVELDNEDDIDKITALSGSGPAYYFFLNRCMRMKALEMGLSEEAARKVVRGTFLGAAKLLEESADCSGKLISKISSKGGTTEAAINHMEKNGMDKIFFDAIESAYNRAKELND